MAAVNGSKNNYPEGQCTVYANERYHSLTGFYVPWSGNAKDWAGLAHAYGWTVSATPIVPSIICLQAGIQGASAIDGHVAVVESINKGTVVTSDLNWGSTPSVVSSVTFATGPGVSFIYAIGPNGKPAGNGGQSFTQGLASFVGMGAGGGTGKTIVQIAPNADVTALLWSWDQVLSVTNPFNVQTAVTDSALGVNFTDPVSWLEGFGYNLFDDAVALNLRLIFAIIGVVVIIKVLGNFIDFSAIFQGAENGVKTVAQGAALL
jgi:surface antigen